MDEVVAFMPIAVLELSASLGFAVAELVDGLGFDRRSLDHVQRVSWDDYATLIERFELACGGPEATDAILLEAYSRAIPERWTERTKHLSPRMFYLMAIQLPQVSNIEQRIDELSDGRILVSVVLKPGSRSCLTFFRGTIATMRGLVGHLGLPPIDAQVLELSDRSLRLVLDVPAAPVQTSWLSAGDALRYTCWLLVGLRLDRLGLEGHSGVGGETWGSLGAATQWVAEHVRASGWERVLLRLTATATHGNVSVSVGSESDAPLHVMAMHLHGREVGILEVSGSGDVDALQAMVPHYTGFLYVELRVAALVRWDVAKPEALSTREHETLRGLMRGRSEKEIAADLDISQHTVHHYVKAIYRQYGARSRAELMARFIDG